MTQHRYHYGAHESQWGELFLPSGASGPQDISGVVVVIHGGYWRAKYGAELGEPLAAHFAHLGIPAWNLEYRRVGNGGGWPATFEDISSGIQFLETLQGEHSLNLSKVVALGHSAGGHLAVWAAGTGVTLTGVVSQAGVLNLAQAEELGLSKHAVVDLLGGSSAEIPEIYRATDPMSAVPLGVPVYAVHGKADLDVPFSQSESYIAAAAKAGADSEYAQLITVPGGHFELINPEAESFATCSQLVLKLLA
ncbi:prolyl oligopeptidase family serine peptidase [Pseudarthrobacter sp. J1738]|uniref:prolyl oligopeptidase family serine peptidase n=1 Tax=unclassified Pseudarthrobacter TaxID=2647000 RepID=UPI003D2CEDA4